MVSFDLPKVDFEAYGEKQELDYKAMLQVLMETPKDPQKGASIDEVRKSIRILDALESAEGTLMLEDADYLYLLERVRSTRFTSNHRVFADFVAHFEKESE